jgi:predicted amidophosphoribosyltransferase
MNWLLVCSNCGSAISRVTPACPLCGAVTAHGRTRPTETSERNVAAHSVFTIVLDALRTRPGRRKPGQYSITEAVNDS